jgi:predicted phosphodiesterase
MKILYEISEDVAKIFREDPSMGRRRLRAMGFTHFQSNLYPELFRNGVALYGDSFKTLPESGKLKRYLLLADIHAPYHDNYALDAALDYGAKIGIDTLILQGDCIDCYSISTFSKDPKRRLLKPEIEQSIPVIEKIANAYSDVDLVYLEGNHEQRLQKIIWNSAPQFDGLLSIPQLYELDRLGFEYVSNVDLLNAGLKPLKIGKIFIIHGHEIRYTSNVIGVARIFFQKCLVQVIGAHAHKTDHWGDNRLDGDMVGAWANGCLCHLHPRYMPKNQWNHGCADIVVDSDGDFSVNLRRIIDGKVL